MGLIEQMIKLKYFHHSGVLGFIFLLDLPELTVEARLISYYFMKCTKFYVSLRMDFLKNPVKYFFP